VVLDAGGEHRVRAGLDEHPVPVGAQRAQRLSEVDGLAQVAVPVLRGQFGGVQQAAGDGGVERHPRGPRRDAGELAEQLLADALDVRRV
jgi:hypothetical protein